MSDQFLEDQNAEQMLQCVNEYREVFHTYLWKLEVNGSCYLAYRVEQTTGDSGVVTFILTDAWVFDSAMPIRKLKQAIVQARHGYELQELST